MRDVAVQCQNCGSVYLRNPDAVNFLYCGCGGSVRPASILGPGNTTEESGNTTEGVGDVNSGAKGSGARYNNGKPPLDLIPVRSWVALWSHSLVNNPELANLLNTLCCYQEGKCDARRLIRAVPDEWMAEASHVFEYGAQKYARWNWAKGMDWSIPIGCILRHADKIVCGVDLDEESGRRHEGHIACNVVMLHWYETYYTEGDTRPRIAVDE